MPAFYVLLTLQAFYLLLITPERSGATTSIRTFLSTFNWVLLEFRFIPLNALHADSLIDAHIPLRGIYSEEL
jgi:hypothetical protein